MSALSQLIVFDKPLRLLLGRFRHALPQPQAVFRLLMIVYWNGFATWDGAFQNSLKDLDRFFPHYDQRFGDDDAKSDVENKRRIDARTGQSESFR